MMESFWRIRNSQTSSILSLYHFIILSFKHYTNDHNFYCYAFYSPVSKRYLYGGFYLVSNLTSERFHKTQKIR
jgi:hypothetical protein